MQENSINEQETVEEINPISRLMQIQQAKKEREPVYTLVEERKQPRRREFFMQASVVTLVLIMLPILFKFVLIHKLK